MKYFLLIWMLCPLASLHAAGPGIRIACYNAESLHDTIPDRLIDDGDYTPRGARQWNGERYRLKIGHIARVIDELDADLLLLTEIENESVLRDLMLATSSDYNYIHRHTSDRRGMDIALLYRGSLFFPGRVRQIAGPGLPRELLVVDGLLDGEPLTLIGAHLPSQLNRASYRLRALGTLRKAVDSILRRDPDRKLLVMGDMNCTPQSAEAVRELGIRDPADTVREGTYRRVPLYTPLLGPSRRSFGSYAYRDRRFLYDWIAASPAATRGPGLRLSHGGAFARGWMLHSSGPFKGYPLRTFRSREYLGGYSDHLPVYVELEASEPE